MTKRYYKDLKEEKKKSLYMVWKNKFLRNNKQKK